MSLVLKDTASHIVSGIHPSVSAAYKALEKDLGVSRPALYGKLNGMELGIFQALVRYSASNLESLIDEFKVNQTQLLAGYEIKIADGNHLGGTEHRLKVLRNNLSKALPGKSIAVLDPQKMLVTDIFLHQDGHAQERTMLPELIETVQAQERTMLPELIETVQAQQVWIADRNFCTRQLLFEVVQRGSDFVIRQHKSLPVKEISALQKMSETPTGQVFEQCVAIVAFNILSTAKAALKSVHGVGKVEAGLSDYYLVEEVQATYRGMAIALPTPLWLPIAQMSLTEFAQTLKQWASLVNLKRFCSSPRKKKKKKPKPIYDPKHPHRSTARLLQQHE